MSGQSRFSSTATLALLSFITTAAAAGKTILDPNAIPHFADPLPTIGKLPAQPSARLSVYEVNRQLLPRGYPTTRIWAYGASAETANYPGITLEVEQNHPAHVTWTSELPPSAQLFDDTVVAGKPSTGLQVRLRGSQQPSWCCGPIDPLITATPFTARYDNSDEPGTYWYHDNTPFNATWNRYAGLVGMYIVRNPELEKAWNLPSGTYEVPIVLEDKTFYEDGALKPLAISDDPAESPFGKVILANGKAWPYLDVEQHRYRFRLLNASQHRFFKLGLSAPSGTLKPRMFQIGADGGYLKRPVLISHLLLAPGEIGDIVVDFVGYRTGIQFDLLNTAATPYPNGSDANLGPTGQVMQFRMVPSGTAPLLQADMTKLQENVFAAPEKPVPADLPIRQILVHEATPLAPGRQIPQPAPVEPAVGDVALPAPMEVWEVINPTAEAHVLQVDGMQFKVLSRHTLRASRYLAALDIHNMGKLSHHDHSPLAHHGYVTGESSEPESVEQRWRHVVQVTPGAVTRVVVRWPGKAQPLSPLVEPSALQALAVNFSFTSGWQTTPTPCACKSQEAAQAAGKGNTAADTRVSHTLRE